MLRLSPAQLAEVRDTLVARLREGVRADGHEIAAKPSFLGRPRKTPGPPEPVAVVEWGGTHLRVASSLDGQVGRITSRSVGLSSDRASDLFDWQASQLKRLGSDHSHVGYIFTFPARFTPDGDATIEAWGKEVDFPELLGRRVGEFLRDTAKGKGVRLGKVVVLDDSVAALLGGASLSAASMGLIVGTGTNLAAFFDSRTAPKLAALPWDGPMALSLETDQFHPPHLTALDEELDRRSAMPGRSRYEKAVGGRYLPKLFNLILPQVQSPPRTGEELAALLVGGTEEERAVARALYDRSADLVAAGIAAVAAVRGDRGPVVVQSEGSMFKVPGYRERVESQANQLTRNSPTISVATPIEHLNILGAAAASRNARTGGHEAG